MKSLAMLLPLVFLFGCKEPGDVPSVVVKDPVDGKSFYLTSSAKVKTLGLCQELAQVGNLKNARNQIRSDMAQIRELIRTDDLVMVKDQIQGLSQRIQQNSNLMIQMTGEKYTLEEMNQRLRWDLTPTGLGIIDQGYWQIANVRIERVYNWQGESGELSKATRTEFNKKNIVVKFERIASALELCQLQQTIVVHLRVEFKNQFGGYKVSHYKLLAKNAGGN